MDEFDGQRERRGVMEEGLTEVVERRQHPRFAVDGWAEVVVADGSLLFRGRVLDVSLAGCYIETEARLRLAPGTLVEDGVSRERDGLSVRWQRAGWCGRAKALGFSF